MLFLLLSLSIACQARAAEALGTFDGRSDIGRPSRPGSIEIDSVAQTYRVTGGGANMWFTNDALHFVWKKVSGDLSLSANLEFLGNGLDPHRKACLLIRQSLDSNAAYADAALHGDGLTSLQYRETQGGPTREIQSNVRSPTRLRLEKRGHYISMSIARAGDSLQPAGGSIRLVLNEPFYVGLGVCAHNDTTLETAVFSQVELTASLDQSLTTNSKPRVISTRAGANLFRQQIQPVLREFCFDCHAEGARKGGVAFDEFNSDQSILEDHSLWFKALKNVRADVMPPAKSLSQTQRNALILKHGSNLLSSRSTRRIRIPDVSPCAD
ncbi:MAG: hypothetical protein EXS36_05825 [Pedosphaera sp.]|nr:hypothetical protein [Pedosphaera sp.]